MSRPAEQDVWRTLRALVFDLDRRREVSDELDMSWLRIKALQWVSRQPSSLSELATVLGTDRPYTTLVVDDLERRDYVTRGPHPDDRRAKIVAATPAGRRVATKATALLERPPDSMRHFSDRDLRELRRLLGLLAEER